jgi:8-oxo-dGTP pyrophosphatase MutT (NUDIX family)
MTWPAVRAAQLRDEVARVPFAVGRHRVGSVARIHLGALSGWPRWLQVQPAAVVLTSDEPSVALHHINAALRDRGLVPGWRNEIYAVTDLDSGQHVAQTERAAARFWGTLTQGAHATGFVADATGRPTHLWIARRSLSKATDPGRLDNLVGGGVALAQTPLQALVREGWEEAGLSAAAMAAATPGRIIRLHRDVPEGLQLEDLYSHDLQLQAGVVPLNQDGEVDGFACMPVALALSCASGHEMTVDASLVTLDFALRHGLCAAPAGAEVLMRSD